MKNSLIVIYYISGNLHFGVVNQLKVKIKDENRMLIKSLIKKIIPSSWSKQLLNFKRLAVNYGQYYTIKNKSCVDQNLQEIPWYTYPAIEYLNNLDYSTKTILEFGSGNSTKFWSRRAKHVYSIEHEKLWYEMCLKDSKENQTLFLTNRTKDYENTLVNMDKKVDVIIIDGIRRVECSRVIGNYLDRDSKEGVMVILDNSDWYKNTAQYLRAKLDLIEIDFHGFTPINSYTSTTSIFISRNFAFKPVDNVQPNFSIAALVDKLD